MSNERHSHWSITINNPTAADEEHMNIARQKGWKVEGQLEKGANGTPHYQLLVSTGQVRFSAVKKMFPRAHIEPARNVAALRQYVEKEETRQGDLPTQQELYPSMDKTWSLIYDQLLKDGIIINRRPTTYTKAHVDWSLSASADPLYELDQAAATLIRDGYRVESILANPQNRTVFKKWALDVLTRVYRERLLTTQTARQTDTNENGLHSSRDQQHTPNALSEENNSSSELSQEVNVPTFTPTDQEGDDASSEEGDSSSSRG